jgi:tripartite-type tricarboxylate transporter receptor subunit TctC
MKRFLCAAAILILSFASAATAAGQDAAQFYKTHTLTLGSPNSAGGGYDIYVRALARHLGKYIPGNPNIVVQNVPAAGGMAFANQLYNTLPKDGSYIGMVRGTAIQEEVYKSPQVQFHGSRFAWLGNMNSDHDACIVSAGSGCIRSPICTAIRSLPAHRASARSRTRSPSSTAICSI